MEVIITLKINTLTKPLSRLLALHPPVQKKLRTECESLPSNQAGDLPTKDELKHMTYLRKVIHEGTSLLHPCLSSE